MRSVDAPLAVVGMLVVVDIAFVVVTCPQWYYHGGRSHPNVRWRRDSGNPPTSPW